MKHLILSSLSTLTLSLLATPPSASEIATRTHSLPNPAHPLSPVHLVSRGYQGYWVEQGIPSNGAFAAAVKSGKVDAAGFSTASLASFRRRLTVPRDIFTPNKSHMASGPLRSS